MITAIVQNTFKTVIVQPSVLKAVVVQPSVIKSSISFGNGMPGPEGRSAYEIAVADGFTGTESEWLASLAGGSAHWSNIIEKPVMYDRKEFLNMNIIVFNHNMEKYPSAYIEDTGGNRWFPKTLHYNGLNDLTITFDNLFSGTVYLS